MRVVTVMSVQRSCCNAVLALKSPVKVANDFQDARGKVWVLDRAAEPQGIWP